MAQFYPNEGHRNASLDPVEASNAFLITLLIMVTEIRFNFQICVNCAAKKTFLKSFSISDEKLSKFGLRGTPYYIRVTSKGSRTMVFEWHDKRDKTRFGSVTRGGRFFCVVIRPKLNSVDSGVLSYNHILILALNKINIYWWTNLWICYTNHSISEGAVNGQPHLIVCELVYRPMLYCGICLGAKLTDCIIK